MPYKMLDGLVGGGIVAAVAWSLLHGASASTPMPSAPDARAQTAVSTTTPAPAPTEGDAENRAPHVSGRVFHDETHFVAQNDAYSFVLNAPVATQIKVVVDIDNTAPIELRVYRGDLSAIDYTLASDPGMKSMGAIFNALTSSSEDPATPAESSDPKPELTFLQRGVYRHFESEWIAVQPGDYSVIADNTGSHFTPSRGDAPVHLRIMERMSL